MDQISITITPAQLAYLEKLVVKRPYAEVAGIMAAMMTGYNEAVKRAEAIAEAKKNLPSIPKAVS